MLLRQHQMSAAGNACFTMSGLLGPSHDAQAAQAMDAAQLPPAGFAVYTRRGDQAGNPAEEQGEGMEMTVRLQFVPGTLRDPARGAQVFELVLGPVRCPRPGSADAFVF